MPLSLRRPTAISAECSTVSAARCCAARAHRRARLKLFAPPAGMSAPAVQGTLLPPPREGASLGSGVCLSQHSPSLLPHSASSPQCTHTLHGRLGLAAACASQASQQLAASGFL